MNERKFAQWYGRLGALMILTLWAWPVSAQTIAARELSSRFLFIVDTSAAMRRRAPAMHKDIERLMRSGLNGQLQPGDTVGVWTFDEELYAGRFPLQHWSTETRESVASNVVAFLKVQPYQKKSRFEVVGSALERIVKDSYRLTVLLVTDGDEKISGTPFDREIQSGLDQHFKMQQKAREPFIIVLRASRGQLFTATVNLMPWPVEFPAFPPEPALVEAAKPKPPEQKPAPRPTVPSLIVIGKKPELPVVTNAPAATDTIAVATTPSPTNASVKVEATSPPVTLSAPQLNPGEIRPAPTPILTPTPAEATTKSAEPAMPPPSPSVSPATAPGTVPLVTASPVEAIKPVPGTVVENKPEPPVTTPILPAPVAPSASAPPPVGPSSPANESASTSPSAPVALAVQPEPGFSSLGMAVIGIGVVVLVGGLFFILQRRARHASHASLITRSMDRDRK